MANWSLCATFGKYGFQLANSILCVMLEAAIFCDFLFIFIKFWCSFGDSTLLDVYGLSCVPVCLRLPAM